MDAVSWHRDERVLDVGCGTGFLLIEAAKHMMTSGTATGSYVWKTDGGEQSAEVAWRNAHLEESPTASKSTVPMRARCRSVTTA